MAPSEPEDGPGRERQERARDEGHGRDRVAQDEDDGSPDPQSFDPLGEAGDVPSGLPAGQEQAGQEGKAEHDIEDELAL